jgi:hypothetical protein
MDAKARYYSKLLPISQTPSAFLEKLSEIGQAMLEFASIQVEAASQTRTRLGSL